MGRWRERSWRSRSLGFVVFDRTAGPRLSTTSVSRFRLSASSSDPTHASTSIKGLSSSHRLSAIVITSRSHYSFVDRRRPARLRIDICIVVVHRSFVVSTRVFRVVVTSFFRVVFTSRIKSREGVIRKGNLCIRSLITSGSHTGSSFLRKKKQASFCNEISETPLWRPTYPSLPS